MMFMLSQVDFTKSLDNQGPFTVFVHKLTDIIASANQGDQNVSKTALFLFIARLLVSISLS